MNEATKAPERIWAFDRYVNGVLMAEGVEVTRAASFEEACVSAARLASRGQNGEVPVLVLATPAALAASPEVAALIREAEARGMERAAGIVQRDADAANVDAEDAQQRGFGEAAFHIRQSAEAIASTIPTIRAEAAALRGEKEPK